MRSFRAKPTGWKYESYRHALARQGIKTVQTKPGQVMTVRGVRIVVRQHPAGEAYPVTPKDVQKQLEGMPKEDIKGLKAVEFVTPNEGAQREAWAQFVRSRRKILIFSQKVGKDGRIGGKDPQELRRLMKGYVVPHELWHHKVLEVEKITDKRLETAEARADGVVFGFDPRDRDIKRFEKYHKG